MSEPLGKPAAADWYYLEEGGSRGPVPASHLRQLVASGVLSPDTLVWREGMTDWLPASELGLTVRAVPPPPPRSAQQLKEATYRQRERRADGLPAADRSDKQATPPTTTRRRRRQRAPQQSTPRLWMVIAAASLLVVGVVIGYALRRDSSGRVAAVDAPSMDRPAKAASTAGPARTRSANDASMDVPGVGGIDVPVESATGSRPQLGMDGTTSPFRAADVTPPAGDADGTRRDLTGPATESPSGTAGTAAASTTDSLPTADESGPPGTLFQEIDMHRRPSYGIAGGAMAQDIRYLILSRLNLQPRQADATRTVTQEVLGTRLKQADEMSRLALEANLEQLKGKKFVYKLGELGDVVEFTGYDKRPGAVPVSRDGSAGFMVADVLDEDGWKEMTHLSFLEPDKHIAPGQPWTRQFVHDWGQVGSWTGVTTYAQDSAVGSNLRFHYTHNLTYKPPSSTVSGLLPFNIGDPDFHLLEASGWFLYNPTVQHVTEAHETFHVKGGFGSELLGGAAKIEIEERQEVSIRLTRQNPW